MANKRTLKKNISRICSAIAGDAILATHLDPRIDRDKIETLVRRIAALQEDARAKVTFWFDKSPRDFADRSAYRKARKAYFRAAYTKLCSEFNHEIISILKELNATVPADVRQTVTSVK